MTKNTFLNARLAAAISEFNLDTIKNVLSLLKRELTQTEKEALIVAAKQGTPDEVLEAIYFTGLNEHITQEFILEFAKQKTANFTKVSKLNPEPNTTESIISYCISGGEILEAVRYAQSIGRILSKEEIILCLENAIAKEDFDDPSTITAIKELLGIEKLSLKHRKILIKKYRNNYSYTEFRNYGGKSSDLTIAWFKDFIRSNIQWDVPGNVLKIIYKERLYKIKALNKTITNFFKHIASTSNFPRELQGAFVEFNSKVPKDFSLKCFELLIDNKNEALPSFFVNELNFDINDKIIAMYIKYLKKVVNPGNTIAVQLEEIEVLSRPLTQKEKSTILNCAARSGNYEVFFQYAEKYSFEPTSYMIKTLQMNNA